MKPETKSIQIKPKSKPNLKIQASQPKAEEPSPRPSLEARRQSLLALAGASLFATLQGVALQGGPGRGALSGGPQREKEIEP